MTTKNVVVLDEIMKTSVGRNNNVYDPPPNTAVLAIISFLATIHLFRLHLNFLFDLKKKLQGVKYGLKEDGHLVLHVIV